MSAELLTADCCEIAGNDGVDNVDVAVDGDGLTTLGSVGVDDVVA